VRERRIWIAFKGPAMPEVSRFFGVSIRMYFDDHHPPHFHAIYGDAEAVFGIEPLALLRGRFPRRAVGLVMEWAATHQRELLANWQLMRDDQLPNRIDPLD
jgi:hypothetical protein